MNTPLNRFLFRPCLSLALAAGFCAVTNPKILAADQPWEKLTNGVVGQAAEFEGVGGVKIAGYIRRPEGPGPFPLVILLHGAGPKARPVTGATEEERAEKAEAEAARASAALGKSQSPPIPDFLAQGWAVYFIDYRPNPRYKIDPLEFDDTVKAFEKAKSFSFVDPKRIAIIGGSHGGHVTGRMASRVDVCCAILCAPAGLDLISLSQLFDQKVKIGANQGLVREMEQRNGVKMAEVEKDPAKYHYTSLMTEVSQVKCPIFLISGVNDPNAPLQLMDKYLDALRAAGKEVAPPYHPANGPHGFYVGLPHHIPETDEATKQEIAFLKKYLDKPAQKTVASPSGKMADAAKK